MRIIDLSVALKNGIVSEPPHMAQSITYSDHAAGAKEFMEIFPGLKREQILDGQGPALERVSLTTHNGTHLDAPWHMHPTMDGGKPAISIDQVPLEWCFSDGIKLDFRAKPDGYLCKADDVRRELKRIACRLKPLDIVLVNTAAGGAQEQPDYRDRGCGLGREATLYLLERGVRVTGTDGDASLIWEGHKVSSEIGYCHMEKLANLDKLPPQGFKVACFPVKIEAASAGWTRAVAILPD